MRSNLILAGMILVYVVIGGIASEVGLTQPIIAEAIDVPQAPSEGGNWLDKLASILAPFAWAFNAVAGIFQLALYQADGVPVLVNTLILIPMGTLLIFRAFDMVRGR